MSKKYNEEIRRYEEAAEDKYDDYDDYDDNYEDYDEDHFDSGLDGYDSYEDGYVETEYVGEDNYDDSYDNYDQASIGKIDPNDRTLTITIANDGVADADIVLFGANEGLQPPAGVTITVQESSHNEVREESKANPFKIQGMKMSVTDPLQFDNIWSIVKRTSTGTDTSHKYQPRNAASPQNTDKNLIDDSSFEMDVTGQDSIRFTVLKGIRTTLTLTVRARVDIGNVLAGNNVAEMTNAPRPTGLPQIDLMQQRSKPLFGMKQRPRRMVRRIVRKPMNKGPHRPHPKRHLKKRRPNG